MLLSSVTLGTFDLSPQFSHLLNGAGVGFSNSPGGGKCGLLGVPGAQVRGPGGEGTTRCLFRPPHVTSFRLVEPEGQPVASLLL